MTARFSRNVAVGMIMAMAALVACNIEVSGPGDTTNNGMPYVRQETGDYCMPASIQMAAKFNRITPPSQATLFANMHGAYGGVEIQYIAPELARSAGMWDAVMDQMFFTDNAYYRRQISAAVQPSPVIALINGGYHGGVLNGGQWHKTTNSAGEEVFVWDQVKFHDPLRGPDQLYTASTWAAVNCGDSNPVCYQALSNNSASHTADVDVVMYGGSGQIEREYQQM